MKASAKISTFVLRIWRGLSILLVFGLSVFSYSIFVEDVGIHFDQFGKADRFLRKSDIFYVVVGLIVANNVLLKWLGDRLLTLPSHLLPIPNQNFWANHRDQLNEHLKNWFYALIASINTVTGLSMLALATVNSNQFKNGINDFIWLFYLTVGMLLFIIVALPVRLSAKPKLATDAA